MPACVLLVDANSSNRANWEAFLKNHGYRVFATDSGNSALLDSLRIQPDVILMGDSLPDISGFEVCRQLKSGSLTQHTPVVMMLPTTNSTAPMQEKTHAAGVDDFWCHPGSRWEALNRIQSILQVRSYVDQQAESVVLALARSLEARDPGTEGHSERLAEYALELGEFLGLSDEILSIVRLASRVHDIGKVAVPDSILCKPGPLDSIEMEIMRQHPLVGENICAPLKSFRDALPAIRHHHERMDGSGYPDGLKGEDIPLTARILQVADIYDALTSDRPYRKALPEGWALAIMRQEARRGWLDVSLVCALAQIKESAGIFVPAAPSFQTICTV